MKYLLDTNIVVLALTDDPKLPNRAREIIDSPETRKIVSIASIWEIAIKHIKNPAGMALSGEVVVTCLEEYGIPLLSINLAHIFTLGSLHTTNDHRDPFDRLLLAQSKHEGITLVTCDGELDGYNEPTLLSLQKGK